MDVLIQVKRLPCRGSFCLRKEGRRRSRVSLCHPKTPAARFQQQSPSCALGRAHHGQHRKVVQRKPWARVGNSMLSLLSNIRNFELTASSLGVFVGHDFPGSDITLATHCSGARRDGYCDRPPLHHGAAGLYFCRPGHAGEVVGLGPP